PGAVSLPVLSDDERAEVGTLFHHEGPFVARKVGAALVSANIARHLREHLADKRKDYRPLVYCWRGGQRSGSMALVLAQVGWRVTVLSGGYRTYRAHVRRELDVWPVRFAFKVVSGPTGSGKTRLLGALRACGAQVLDLEGLAGHRGSALGAVGPQPSQKMFDSRLLEALGRLDPARPVWVEAESNRVGDVFLPPALWAGMQSADGVELNLPLPARVSLLLEEYAHFLADADGLKAKLRKFVGRHSAGQVGEWCQNVDAGAWADLAESLLVRHYDPAYTLSARRNFPRVCRPASLPDGASETLLALASNLAAEARLPAACAGG
ncbi:MAG: tRNA 2-selenouridine(34) synthase MnmH, partial [Gemmataceae bacterium]|nr:tRNA 2-selenouridine(34) synthase MnmH [Gemmataceae bacterium]